MGMFSSPAETQIKVLNSQALTRSLKSQLRENSSANQNELGLP